MEKEDQPVSVLDLHIERLRRERMEIRELRRMLQAPISNQEELKTLNRAIFAFTGRMAAECRRVRPARTGPAE